MGMGLAMTRVCQQIATRDVERVDAKEFQSPSRTVECRRLSVSLFKMHSKEISTTELRYHTEIGRDISPIGLRYLRRAAVISH